MTFKATDFIEAIQGSGPFANPMTGAPQTSGGIVSTVARRLNCSRTTVYKAINEYATVQQALDDEREGMKDMAEGEMYKKIKGGDTTMIILYLKTQAKDRGYVERQEWTGKDGDPMKLNVTWRAVVEAAQSEADSGDNA